jgi:hypothetical protein
MRVIMALTDTKIKNSKPREKHPPQDSDMSALESRMKL